MVHHIIVELLPFFPVLFFGIGVGPSKQETSEFGAVGNIGNFATSTGEGDISAANNFWKAIMSGDPSKIATVLGPETSAINKQAQQQKKTASEFGNRGGGTNAAEQEAGDKVRTSYDSMVSSLFGGAASALGASGSSLLAAGASAHEGAFTEANTIQQQKAAKLDDIFKSISAIASAFIPTTTATGATPPIAGGSTIPSGLPADVTAPSGGYGVGSVPGTTGFSPIDPSIFG